jgi:hypothetical protein
MELEKSAEQVLPRSEAGVAGRGERNDPNNVGTY